MDSNLKFWIAAHLAGLGPVRIKRLISEYGSIEKIFDFSREKLISAGIPAKIAENIRGWENLPWQEELDFCRKSDISILTFNDKAYPDLLRQIYDPPMLLFVKGQLPPQESIVFAIVGTRNPTIYGLKMAEKFASDLSYYGIVIASGLARGIDTAAHRGTIKTGGQTIAVLGSGFRHLYPPDNRKLAEKIALSGAVMTEFLSHARPEPGNFPRRNRIVSGLSKGVLVIEAGQKSGALITANLAVEQGRDVFALPGRIDALSSKGTNLLLKEGAALVENAQEIIEGLNLEIHGKNKTAKSEIPDNLPAKEKLIMDVIRESNASVDDLLCKTAMNNAELYTLIVSLLSRNLITELPGKIYAVKPSDLKG